ncbi:MAG: thiamine pyrophosphate-binding protein [Desulfatibacillaceae bacterium]|nr:thiamine pyrophosphate-binding protein [Desulfatibacillaceae bacterium]
MEITNGGEILVQALARQGVKKVFSIIGGQMGTMYDAIGRHPDMEVITPRSEASAALMACGYTASTGAPCVSMATVGAGVVYETAGLLMAWLDYLPVLSIAPQVQSYKMKPHQENLQACDQDLLFAPFTKFCAIGYHAKRLPQLVDRALREALCNIPGPVHLDVPVDILFERQVLTKAQKERLFAAPSNTRYQGAILPDPKAVKRAEKMIAAAKKPLVLLGQGMGRPTRHKELGSLLIKAKIPVIATSKSSGAVWAAKGVDAGQAFVFEQSAAAMKVFNEVDCLIVLGKDAQSARLLEKASLAKTPPFVIHAESDPVALNAPSQSYAPLWGDPERVFAGLLTAFSPDGAWAERVCSASAKAAASLAGDFAHSRSLFEETAKSIGAKDMIVADGLKACHAVTAFLGKTPCKGVFLLDGVEVAGTGLPFAIGAAVGNPASHIYLACEQNALFHNLRETATAVCLGLENLTIICPDAQSAGQGVGGPDTAKILAGLGLSTRIFEKGPALVASVGLAMAV